MRYLSLLLALGLLTGPADAQPVRISLADDGSEANAGSYQAAISEDGTVVAFQSNASNLTVGDTNDWTDVFVRDLTAGTTVRISMAVGGGQSPLYSLEPQLGDNGRFVLYLARSGTGTALPAIHDRNASTTQFLVFDDTNNNDVPDGPRNSRLDAAISGDGRWIAFRSISDLQLAWPASIRPIDDDNNGNFDVFVLDRESQPPPQIERVSRDSLGVQGDADSLVPSLSDSGTLVAFQSYAENLAPIDGNEQPDIFVRDRTGGLTELVSVAIGGGTGNGASVQPMISGNGEFVVFRSRASDLVAGDANGRWDIFIRDRSGLVTERVSVGSAGEEANHHSMSASISDDGRFVAFESLASNLVADDTNQRADIFVHDRATGQTAIVSRPAGTEANGHSSDPEISGDGAWIVFESLASNLVADDSNAASDIFRVPNPLWSNP